MSSKQLIFKEDEVERLRTKIGLLSQDTNHLYLQLKGQASNWNGIPLGNDLQQAQVLLNELTVEAEKLEDVIRGALKGVKGLQEENRRAASQLGQQWSALGGLFGNLGGNGNGGRIPIPTFAQKAATNLIHTVAGLLGWDELNQDPRVQQLQGIIKQIGIGTVEKIAAQSTLQDIFEARDQIAKAQTAFGVYQAFGNQSQMNAMHKLAEDARAKLESLGVDAVHYEVGKDLSGHFKQAAIQACDYDPSIISSNVPLVQNESYLLLLRMAMETGAKGDWAKSQLAGKRLDIKLAEAARIIAEQMAAERRLNGPPMELPDGIPITPYNMENETTLNYFRERVSDPKETNQVLAYYVWLEETYGMTEWRKKVVQADAVTRAFAGALIKETVMGVVDTAKLAFNFVVDPEKTTQDAVDKMSYLVQNPEVLVEAARTVYNNFDEGTPEQRAAMLGSVASLLVPGLQITKGGKLGKVVDGVQEVVTQTVDKVKDISKGIQRSDALGNLKPFGSMALPGGMGSIQIPNDFQDTARRLDSPEIGSGRIIEGTSKGAEVTKGYDVTPKYSSYKERLDRTPKNNGTWEAERGESNFVSEKPEVKEYLDEAGVDGVEYKNAIPDFSPFTKDEVKIPNMTNDRRKNFANADETLANQWSTPEKKWTADDVADWREDNNYTWHELNDLESMQLVPGKINGTFNHLGGVGEHNIKEKLGE
ncbi:HNH endonuclease [Paenibacillus monticola]|uniref:Pre-toxin TG domain-containing protein n=1 Tax=Paenibacillus monticola TaxID=2666075 RepID=A0A7X2L543_9BACL|nr:HNH endonuclease [Paenibacillus monticola]MRN56046.1 hypothetical protein [Paenibacillus monticola]